MEGIVPTSSMGHNKLPACPRLRLDKPHNLLSVSHITNPRALKFPLPGPDAPADCKCVYLLRGQRLQCAHNTTPAAYPNQTFADWQI